MVSDLGVPIFRVFTVISFSHVSTLLFYVLLMCQDDMDL